MLHMVVMTIRAFIRWVYPKPLDNLVITDFDILVPYTDAIKNYDETCEEADAYNTMVMNCAKLKLYGAHVDKDKHGNFVPFTNVSGMKFDIQGLRYPSEIVGGKSRLGMLLWGSPHPCLSSNAEPENDTWIGTRYTNHTPKTEAFEIMLWDAPEAIVVMTFSKKYRCEFYQPQWSHDSTERQLRLSF